MISFLSPWGLLALPLAAAPWILHRWSASKARLQPFPALDLLRAAQRSSFASSVLSHRLLLAARTLLMFFLAMFLSRPVLRRDSGGGRAPDTLILLVDISASMGARVSGRTRLDWAREEARAFRPSGGSGRVGLVSFSDRVEST